MTNEELNKERQHYYHTRKVLHFYNIYTAFMENPEAFDKYEIQILDGFWDSIEAQQDALWHYYKGCMARLMETLNNL